MDYADLAVLRARAGSGLSVGDLQARCRYLDGVRGIFGPLVLARAAKVGR